MIHRVPKIVQFGLILAKRNFPLRLGTTLVLLLFALTACEEAVEPKPPELQPPVAVGTIGAITLTVGATPATIEVAGKFNDPDGQTLTYSARSSDLAIATTAAVGSTVTVTAVAQGTATITVTATDEDNLSATQTFSVTVVVGATAPRWIDTGASARNWTANTAIPAFTVPAVDEGSPAPTYSASGLPAGISFSSTTRRVSGTPSSTGSGTITITATNSAGSDTYTIPYTVAAAPTPRPTLPFKDVLNPDGHALTNELYTLPLGTSSAEVFVISTNTTTRRVAPNIVRLDSGRRAEHLSQPRSATSQPVPEPVWLRDLQKLPPLRSDGLTDRGQHLAKAQSLVVAEGDSFTFVEQRDNEVLVPIQATVRKVIRAGATTLAVWVADREWWTTCVSIGQCLNQEMVDALATRFLRPGANNDIYDWVTTIFGAPWGPHRYSDLISPAAASQIHILLLDIKGDGAGSIFGYFSPLHNSLRKPSYPITRISSERLIFFMDSAILSTPEGATWDITDLAPSVVVRGLAHEFQHMIHYYQKLIRNGLPPPASEVWLNEMASLVAEELFADKLRIPGPRGVASNDRTAGAARNPRGRLPLYNANNFRQVTAWYSDLESYSINYALGAYLARTYGAGLFREIVQNDRAGVAAIEAALVSEGHGVSFGDVLTNWAIANLLSDDTSAPRPYRYNSGTWFTSAVGGQTFRLGSINLFNYRYREPGHPLDGWDGPWFWPLISFNALPEQLPHSNLYVTIGRTSGTVRLRINAPAGNRITVVVKE